MTAGADVRRVGLIGLGAAGSFAAQAIAEMPEVRIVAAVDPMGEDAPAVQFIPADVGMGLSLEALSVAPVDTAMISVPTKMHASVALAVFAADLPRLKAVWSEKPLAASELEADALFVAASERGVDVRTLFHTAYAPEVSWAVSRSVELLKHSGPIVRVRSEFHDPYLPRVKAAAASLTDCWLDSGINALSVIARFVGSQLLPRACRAELPHQATASLVSSGDPQLVVEVGTAWTPSGRDKATVVYFADGGFIEIKHSSGAAREFDATGEVKSRYGPLSSPISERYRRMLDAYHNNAYLFTRADEQAMYRCLGGCWREMRGSESSGRHDF